MGATETIFSTSKNSETTQTSLMKFSGLSRLFFSSVLSLLLVGGLMTAQAQDQIVVDEDDPNADAQTIPNGLSQVDDDGDVLIVRAGGYTGQTVSTSSTSLSSGDSFVMEARTDDDSGAEAVEIDQFTVSNNIGVTVQSDGTGFFELNTGGAGLNLDEGDLSLSASQDLELLSGVTVTVGAGAGTGGNVTGNAPTFGSNINVTYVVNNSTLTAGLEAPTDLGSGVLTVQGANGNTVTFPSGRFGALAAQEVELNANDNVGAVFEGDLSVTNAFISGNGNDIQSAQSLTVQGTLTIEGTNNALQVDAGAAGSADEVSLGALEFASVDAANVPLLGGTGTLTVDGAVTFQIVAPNSGGSGVADDFEQEINASASSSNFTIGSIVETEVTDGGGSTDRAVVDIINANGGTVALGGGTFRQLDQSAGPNSTFQVTGNVESDVTGFNLLNGGDGSTVEVTAGNTLTLLNSGSGAATHNNADNGGFTGSGTVRFENGSGVSQTVVTTEQNGTANLDINRFPSVEVAGGNGLTLQGSNDQAAPDDAAIQIGGDLIASADVTLDTGSGTVSDGAVRVGGSITVNGGTTNLTSVVDRVTTADVMIDGSGTLNTNGNRLEVRRNFTRVSSNSSLATNGSSVVAFTGGGIDGTFDTQSLFTINGTVEVDKTNATLTLQEAVRVNGDFNIVDQGAFLKTNLVLQDNLFLNSPTGTFTIDSNLDTGEDSHVVFEDALTVAGDDTLGNAIVNGGVDITVQPTASPNTNTTTLKFDGALELRDGGVTIAAGEDLSPAANTGAEIIRTIDGGGGQQITANGTFNADNSLYDLTYRPDGSTTVTDPTTAEITDNMRDLTVRSLAVPRLDDSYDVNGALTVEVDGQIDDDGGGARTLNLLADGATHTINGFVGGLNNIVALNVTGDNVTINGGSGNDADDSQVQDVRVAGSGTVISGLQEILGRLNLDSGDLELGMQGDQRIATNSLSPTNEGLTVNDSLSLASDVEIEPGNSGSDEVRVTSSGKINFGSSDLLITDSQGSDVDVSGDAGAEYFSDGGTLVFDSANNPTFGTAGEVVPRVTIEQSSISLTSDAATGVFLGADQNIDLNGSDFEVSGEVEFDGGDITDSSGGGIFRSVGTTISSDATVTITRFEVDSAPDTTELVSPTGSFDPQTELLLTGGVLEITDDTQVNSFAPTVTVDSADVLNPNGTFILNTTSSAISIDPVSGADDTLSITNTEVFSTNNDVSLGGDGLNVEIGEEIVLNGTFDASTANGQLVIADGGTIRREAVQQVLEEPVSFAGVYNLEYSLSSDADSGFELTDAEDTLWNLDVLVSGGDVLTLSDADISGDATVNGTLHLQAGFVDYTSRQLVLADSSTLRQTTDEGLDGGPVDNNPITAQGMYFLQYDSANITTSDAEFLDGGVAYLQVGTILPNGNPTAGTTTLHADRTVSSFSAVTSGGVNLNTTRLTVDGPSVVHRGTVGSDGGEGVLAAQGTFVQNGGVITDPFAPSTERSVIEADSSVTINGGGFGANSELAFTGTGDQAFNLPAGMQTVNQLRLAQTDSSGVTPRVKLNDANLTALSVVFSNGLLETGQNRVQIGTFTRGNVGANDASHVVGTVRQFINAAAPNGGIGRYEFPVGTDTSATLAQPEYRPYTLTFDQNDPPITSTNIDVRHVDENPRGQVGLPFTDSEGVTTGNYPDFYWLVQATTSLGAQQTFDIELVGDHLGVPFDDEEDLRIIRRFDGNAQNNEWRLQGEAADYDNILEVQGQDSTVTVRNIGSQGGLVTQATRVTIGIPSRAPAFTNVPTDSLVVEEDSTVQFAFQAEGRDIGSELGFSMTDAPDNSSFTEVPGHDASLDASQSGSNGGFGSGTSPGSGSATFAVNQDSDGNITSIDYTVTIDGLDASGFTDMSGTSDADDDLVGLHIHNAARGQSGGIVFGILGDPDTGTLSPDSTDDADRSISVDGTTLRITGSWDPDEATDPNDFADALLNTATGNDVPLYANVHTSGNQGGEIRGQLTVQETALFSFTPDFDQQGSYTPVAEVTDTNNGLTTTSEFAVEVLDNTPEFTLGDINGNGECQAAEVSLILAESIGKTGFSPLIPFDLSQRLAADVSGDGEVNAGDASILKQFLAGNRSSFPAGTPECSTPGDGSSGQKALAAIDMSKVRGTVEWGDLRNGESGQTLLPLTLSGDAQNVRSVQMTANYDASTVTIKDVTTSLPSGWEMVYDVDAESGTVKIAMAGAQPAPAGKIADLAIEIDGENAEARFAGDVLLNTGTTRQLSSKAVSALPGEFALESNRPNPVQTSTTIEYSLPEQVDVTLEVYNVLGQRVATLVDEKKSAGTYQVNLDASDLSSGVYMYRLNAGSFSETSRMTVVR